jgi:hypothetical protein
VDVPFKRKKVSRQISKLKTYDPNVFATELGCSCAVWEVCDRCDGVPRQIGFNTVDLAMKVDTMVSLERKYPKAVYPTAVDGYAELRWLGYRRIFGGSTSISHASYTIFFLYLQFGLGYAAPSQWAEDYALVAPATSWLVIAFAVLWLVHGLLSRFDKYAEQAKKAFYWSLGLQGFIALIGLGSIFSTWFASSRPPGKWWNKMNLEAQGARQTANKGGMFMTGMLSLFMLLLAPVLGAKRIVELFKPVLELFKQIPYATWMCEWLHDWWNGKVDFDDLPEDPHDEARQYAKKVYGDYCNAQRDYDGARNTEPTKPKGFRYHGRGTTINMEGTDYCRVIRFDIKQEQPMRLEDLRAFYKMQRFEVPITCKLFNKERIFTTSEEFSEFLDDPNGPYERYLAEGHVIARPKDESSKPIANVISFDYSHMEGATEVMKAEEKLAKAKQKFDALNSEQKAFVEEDEDSTPSTIERDIACDKSVIGEHNLEPQCCFEPEEEEEARRESFRPQAQVWKREGFFNPKQYWGHLLKRFGFSTEQSEEMKMAVDETKERADKDLPVDEDPETDVFGFGRSYKNLEEKMDEYYESSPVLQKIDACVDDWIVQPLGYVTDCVAKQWRKIPLKGRKAIKMGAIFLCVAAYAYARSRESTEMEEQKAGWNLRKGGRKGKNRRQAGGPRRNFGKHQKWDYSEGMEDHAEDLRDDGEYGHSHRMDNQAVGPTLPDVADDSVQQRAIYKSKKLRIRVDTQDYVQWMNESRQNFQRQLEQKKLTKQAWKPDELAGGVYKIFDANNNYLCTGTLVADQMFVVMHALSEDLTRDYFARNHVHSIVMKARTLTVHNDHIASFKVSGFSTPFKANHMKILKESSIVTVYGYGDGSSTRPESITGFASPTGWCTAATRRGDCTSPVLDKDGFVVGFWTHGDGDQFGRFEVVTEDLLNFIKHVKPVTHSGLDFQSCPRSLEH